MVIIKDENVSFEEDKEEDCEELITTSYIKTVGTEEQTKKKIIVKKEFDENNNDKNEEKSKKQSIDAGKIVWGKQSRFLWYPCMILAGTQDEKIAVGYFKGSHNIAYLPARNIYEFDKDSSVAKQNFAKIVKTFPGKQSIANNCSREIEAAKYFQEFPINDRIDIYNKIQEINFLKKSKSLSETSIDLSISLNENNKIEEFVRQFFDKMSEYDRNQKEQTQIKRQMSIDSKASIKKEKVILPVLTPQRSSTRIVSKRQMVKEEPVVEKKETKEPKPPRPKKRKIVKEQTLQELFLPDHIEEDKDCLFRCEENEFVCWKCLTTTESDLMTCDGSCNKKFHKECLKEIEVASTSQDEMKAKYLCEICSKGVKMCCICNEDLNTDERTNFSCKQSECNSTYHKKCLELLSKNSKTCLKHYCHTCHLKDCSKDGQVVTCVKCPMSYHADILCIPVATQVISRTQIICPRHQPSKSKSVNLDFCNSCGQSGTLICCDMCPRAYHKECMTIELPDDDKKLFKCDECSVGIVPLYNSVVWAKFGNFRWWPGFVLIPWVVPLEILHRQKSEWEFCVRFLGTHDFCFTTCDKVFTYDTVDTIPKLSNKTAIDQAFNKALVEGKDLLAILEKDDTIELEKTDSNEFEKTGGFELKSSKCVYKPIQISRPIPPVKLKKSSPEPCNCKETDDSPCTRKSNCINVALLIECDESCAAGRKCQNQKVRNRDNANLRIIKTNDRGFGAFCTEDIEPNTFIIEYIGELINNDELNRRLVLKKKRKEKEYYFLTIQNNLHIDAEFYSNKGRFVNHSCDPNCDIRKITVDGITRIGIFSNQFIKAGNEVTFNYQMKFGKGCGIKCNCGAATCTGVIGDFFK